MAKGVGGASAGHAVQLAAETLKGIAVVIDGIGSRKQLARFREQDDHTAHDQTSGSNVDITRETATLWARKWSITSPELWMMCSTAKRTRSPRLAESSACPLRVS